MTPLFVRGENLLPTGSTHSPRQDREVTRQHPGQQWEVADSRRRLLLRGLRGATERVEATKGEKRDLTPREGAHLQLGREGAAARQG